MMNILHDSDYNRSKAFNFRVGKENPLILPDDEYYSDETDHGHLAMSNKDLYYCSDEYRAIVTEDTRWLANNIIDGNSFVFNRWFYLKASYGLGFDLSPDSIFACNYNHYYVIKTSGRISPNPAYNNFNIDFTDPLNDELWFQLQYSLDNVSWITIKQFQLPYINSSYRVDSTFMNVPESHGYYRARIYLPAYPSQEIEIIDGFNDFSFGIELIRKPRLSWKNKYLIMPVLDSANSENITSYPDVASGTILPFNGVYQIDAYVGTLETDINDIPVNCASPQGLYVSGNGNSYFQIDQSGTGDGGANAPDFFWAPNSLQGSALVEVLGDRNIYLNVFLPNGDKKKVLGGYLHVRFVGDMFSPNLEV